MLKILANLFNNSEYIPFDRSLNLDHFLNDDVKEAYDRDGYVVIKNIVSEEAIEVIINSFNSLNQFQEYKKGDGFVASPQYGKKVQKHIQKELKNASKLIFPKIFDLEKCETDFLNILTLKFNKDKGLLMPHQDTPVLDEQISVTTFSWIPTATIDEKNGSLLVLPGSHKWATWQRTHYHGDTPLSKQIPTLLENMKPLYLSKGDLVLFDSALIHASSPNTSNVTRIAMNACIIPKEQAMIQYLKPENIGKGEIKKFTVDDNYWQKVNYYDSNVEQYQPGEIETLRCKAPIRKKNLLNLIEKYKVNV